MNEKYQKVTQGTTFLENPPSLRGLLVTLRPSDSRSIVRALGRCQYLLLRTVLPMVLVASRHSARGSSGKGANQKNVPLDRVPFAPQYPFERAAAGLLQVPERLKEYCQFGGFAYSSKPPHGPLLPHRGGRLRAAPRKGFLNRRFKRVFAYFCRVAKVGAESGAAQAPGYRYETAQSRPKGGKETA